MDDGKVKCGTCDYSWDAAYWFCPNDGDFLLLGRAVGGEWVLNKKLGQGAMGAVYRARHRLTEALAAVKLLGLGVLSDDTTKDTERYLRESLRRVRHPNCVEIHDVGCFHGVRGAGTALWWIRMDYVNGAPLEELCKVAPLPSSMWLDLAVQMSAGLQACHEAGIIHRDFKPANVMVEAATGRPILADFGIARKAGEPTLTPSGGALGTPLYMAPELFAHARANERSDLFALGVVLYEMMTGKHPFDPDKNATWAQFITRVLSSDPAPLDSAGIAYPLEFGKIVLRLLRKSPEERFASAAEVRDELLNLNHVEVRVFNHDLGLDVVFAIKQRTRLADVRALALGRTTVSPTAKSILENPRTEFVWMVSGIRLHDDNTVADACATARGARPVDLHLRAYPNELLSG